MSLIPEIPVDVLEDLFAPHDVQVTVTDRGVLLQRGDRGYRLALTEDRYARGSALKWACQHFEIDPFDLLEGHTDHTIEPTP